MGDCARILDTVLSDQLMKAPLSGKLGGSLADAEQSASRSQSVSTGVIWTGLARYKNTFVIVSLSLCLLHSYPKSKGCSRASRFLRA